MFFSKKAKEEHVINLAVELSSLRNFIADTTAETDFRYRSLEGRLNYLEVKLKELEK